MLLLIYRSRCSLRNILYMREKKIRVVSPRIWRNDSSISQREVAPSSFSWAKRAHGCVAFRNCRAIDQPCFVITLVWGIVDVLPPVWYSYVSLRTCSVCIDTRPSCDSVIPVISLCRSRSNRYLLCHRGEASERTTPSPFLFPPTPPSVVCVSDFVTREWHKLCFIVVGLGCLWQNWRVRYDSSLNYLISSTYINAAFLINKTKRLSSTFPISLCLLEIGDPRTI